MRSVPGPSAAAVLRAAWLLRVLLALGVSPAAAQPAVCGDCFLGVYDDAAMTRTSGRASSFQVKSVYLGLRLAPGVQISDLTLEAAYPRGFAVIQVDALVAGARYNLAANTAHVHWATCV